VLSFTREIKRPRGLRLPSFEDSSSIPKVKDESSKRKRGKKGKKEIV
jgi:hypothetical protein